MLHSKSQTCVVKPLCCCFVFCVFFCKMYSYCGCSQNIWKTALGSLLQKVRRRSAPECSMKLETTSLCIIRRMRSVIFIQQEYYTAGKMSSFDLYINKDRSWKHSWVQKVSLKLHEYNNNSFNEKTHKILDLFFCVWENDGIKVVEVLTHVWKDTLSPE